MARDYTKSDSIINALDDNSYSDIDIFFNRHPVTNDITVKKDTDAVKRSLRNIVLTNHFERPFKPNFGTNIRKALFEMNDNEVGEASMREIAAKIKILEPRISNLKLRREPSGPNELSLTISYDIINGLSNQSVGFKVNRVR